MKIVHICLGNFYIDNYSYQENLLPLYHKKMGYDVEIIASLSTFDKNGKASFLDKGSTYLTKDNIKIIRLNYLKPIIIFRKLKKYIGLYKTLEIANPDILFIHGCQFLDMNIIVKYLKKHTNIKVYVDNHADFFNSAKNFLSRNILHKILWRHTAKIIEPFASKFYGVLPVRVDFLINMYKLPKEKCELLIMGADDELVNKSLKNNSRKVIREKYKIEDDDFLIVSGGKIDMSKKEILEFIKAVKTLNNKKVKFLIFGSVIEELKDDFNSLCDNNIIFIGWLNNSDSYNIFSAADLVVFPGRHSVYWEQAVAQGIPLLCRHLSGVEHIDIGGNVLFMYKNNFDEYKEILNKIISDKNLYNLMKKNANKPMKNSFLYSKIAKKSIEQE